MPAGELRAGGGQELRLVARERGQVEVREPVAGQRERGRDDHGVADEPRGRRGGHVARDCSPALE